MAKRLPPRIAPDFKGNYYIFYSRNGRSQRVSLRTNNLFKAELRFEGWLEQRRKDTYIEEDPYIQDCLEYWMDQWIRGRMLSENRYPAVVNNLNAYFGKMRVSQITRNESAVYIELRRSAQIGRNCASDATIRHEMTKLRACLGFMCTRVEPRERRLSRDIIPFIEPPQAVAPRDRVLNQAEIKQLRQFCSALVWQGPGRAISNRISKVGRFITLAMETAQRKTAILELKWEQVDFERRIITFNPYGRNQTIKRRPPVPISSRLIPLLARYHEERVNDYVCDSVNDCHEAIKHVGKELQIDGLSAHVFRHTWATNAVIDGKPIEQVAAFLGDTVDTVRKNYIHLTPDYLRSVVD